MAAMRQADVTKSKATEDNLRRNMHPKQAQKENNYFDMKEEQQDKIKRLKEIPGVSEINSNALRAFY